MVTLYLPFIRAWTQVVDQTANHRDECQGLAVRVYNTNIAFFYMSAVVRMTTTWPLLSFFHPARHLDDGDGNF